MTPQAPDGDPPIPTRRRGWVVAAIATVVVLAAVAAVAAVNAGRTERRPATGGGTSPAAGASQFALPSVERPLVTAGDDWSLPDWVRATQNSGFFSEHASEANHIDLRSVDATWRQLAPRSSAEVDMDVRGRAQGLGFDSLRVQLTKPGPFWMRVWASGIDWAPDWVVRDCHIEGKQYRSYDGDPTLHIPFWNTCVWGHLMDLYRRLFVDQGLRADPDLRFVYVPGAFTWAEFDYNVMADAVRRGDLDLATYRRWYERMVRDLVDVFGPYHTKLVFTGQDYPFGPWSPEQNLMTRQAVDAGMGIRDGIVEAFNFHLNEAPSYGSHIQPDGHMVVDETLPVHSGRFVVATENECYNDCGYTSDDPYYVVKMSSLKSLQLRVNWIYVVPGPSYLEEYGSLWHWVRMSLGKTVANSPDAWAALRDAEDTYWADPQPPFTTASSWRNRPFVRNLERWLVQRDVAGDGVTRRSTADVRRHTPEEANGVAYEGLSTDIRRGQRYVYFDLDDGFFGGRPDQVVVKATYLDEGTGPWRLDYAGGRGRSAPVSRTGDGRWKTATLLVPDGSFDDSLAGGTDMRIAVDEGGGDLTVRFVRVVRVAAPTS